MPKALIDVPFTGNKIHWDTHKNEYLQVFDEVLSTGKWQGNDTSEALESALVSITGRNHAILVGSGTEALYLATRALDDGKPDVILPAYSFSATASAVVRAGKNPVFIDVNLYGLMTPPRPSQINSDTSIIMPVHMYGRNTQGNTYNINTIIDNAQGFRRNQYAFKNGTIQCLSFDPMKTLPAFGSAGAILCDDPVLAFLIKGLRNNSPYSPLPSQNSQVPAIISAGLLVSLNKYFNEWNARRGTISKMYIDHIPLAYQDMYPDLTSYHKFPIYSSNRDEMAEYLKERGIETKVHYSYTLPELDQFGGMPAEEAKEKFPNAYLLSRNELSLPIYPQMTNEQVWYVIECVNDFMRLTISEDVHQPNPIRNLV